MRLCLPLLCAFAACAVAAVAAPSWKRYGNDRFGVTAEAPANWAQQPPPENDDGATFVAPDGKASLAIYGGYVMEDSAAAALAAHAEPNDSERVTYKQVGPRTVTVSGFKGDKIFYRHSLLSCGAQVWSNVELDLSRRREGGARSDRRACRRVAAQRRAGRHELQGMRRGVQGSRLRPPSGMPRPGRVRA